MDFLFLTDKDEFPPVENAWSDGFLAAGADLSVERLLSAYKKGIFPWYDGDIPLWYCPDPRFVLFPHELHISKSLQQVLKKDEFEFTINKDFSLVIQHCRETERKGQDGTWINDDIIDAYTRLHELGYVHSAEVWHNNELVGGLYGVRLGKVFFGESMFSLVSNASKIAFVKYVEQLIKEDVQLIDCQVYTEYLESFGARMIDRKNFIQLLNSLL